MDEEAAKPREAQRTADPLAPPVTRADVLRCQIQEWYPRLRSVSIKTKLIPLDDDFVQYLLADGIVLPEGCDPPKIRVGSGQQDQYDSDGWSDDDTGCDEAGEGASASRPKFEGLICEMETLIEELGGSVFPKLNWSCPRDATWINAGENTKCLSPGEVCLLLKSSDLIVHDLCHAFDCCVGTGLDSDNPPTGELVEQSRSTSPKPPRAYLALRKWYDIKPSMEFRCFVSGGRLIAVSQRDVSNFYEFLLDQVLQGKLVRALTSFYEADVRGNLDLPSLVFDAYVRQSDFRVFIIDVNPYGGLTQPLLFGWDELAPGGVGAESAELRVIGDHPSIRPGMGMYGRLPKDMQDVSTQEGIDELVRSCAQVEELRQAELH